MSHLLTQRGIGHVVLERYRIAERWRTDRWNSLAFQMTNEMLELPGKRYDGNAPQAFAQNDDIRRFIEDYAREKAIKVRTETEVLALRRDGAEGYLLQTNRGDVIANQVVIATGPFHQPNLPAFASALPASVHQTDPVRYKSPDQLLAGSVLVVGSGASGTQIADELLRAGRRVFLSLGRHRYAPRRYRGRDIIWWLDALGRFDISIDNFPDGKYPPPTVMTGADGGYDLFPRLLAGQGAVLLGRVTGCAGGRITLSRDAAALLAEADKACRDILVAADVLAAERQLGGEAASWTIPPEDAVADIDQLDLAAHGITTVVWATGYRHDFSWVRLPLFDGRGRPVQHRGVTDCPGVYFLGLHWMHRFGSGLLSYVGRDAAYLVDRIVDRKALRNSDKLRGDG